VLVTGGSVVVTTGAVVVDWSTIETDTGELGGVSGIVTREPSALNTSNVIAAPSCTQGVTVVLESPRCKRAP
jgi:hypothetical protein